MTTTHSTAALNGQSAGETGGPIRAWTGFWFSAVDPLPLHRLRLLTGLLLLAWLLPFMGQVDAFFGLGGWFDRRAYSEAMRLPEGPPVPISPWSLVYMAGADPSRLVALYWLSIAVLVAFTLGLATRITAPLAWAITASFTGNPAADFDADAVLLILSFYVMIGYLLYGLRDRRLSWTERLLGPADAFLFARRDADEAAQPSIAANTAQRLLQVHVAIMFVCAGLHKLQFGDWWAGVAFWYPMVRPFEATLAQVRALAPSGPTLLGILSIAAYVTMAWQVGFPLFAWKGGLWRAVLLTGAAVSWLGAVFLYRLPLFGPALFICCLSYLTAAEWQAFAGLVSRLPGVRRFTQRPEATPADFIERSPARENVPSLASTSRES